MLVELTGAEVARATRSTIWKLSLAQKNGHQNRRTMDPHKAMLFTFQGALAELAVSLTTGLVWTAERAAFVHDVTDLEVRSRGSEFGTFRLRSYELPKMDATQKIVFCTVMDDHLVYIDGWATLGELARTWSPSHLSNDQYNVYNIDPAVLHGIHSVLL